MQAVAMNSDPGNRRDRSLDWTLPPIIAQIWIEQNKLPDSLPGLTRRRAHHVYFTSDCFCRVRLSTYRIMIGRPAMAPPRSLVKASGVQPPSDASIALR